MANISRSRKSGFTLRSGVMRRETLWTRTDFIRATIASADTAVVLFTFSTVITDLLPLTIVRTRGYIHISSDQTANTETQELAFAIAIVSDQASAIGVTAVPTPVADADSDLFFVYEPNVMQMQVSDATGVNAPSGVGRSFDSKAMRKLPDGTNISAVAETAGNSAGAIVTVQASLLIKSH